MHQINPMYFWLGAFVLFGVVEAATAGLTSIWFAVGALVSLIATALGAQVWLQVTLFILASAAAIASSQNCCWAITSLVRRFAKRRRVPTNADRVLGRTARVTETIDNLIPTGAVYVDGKTWTARSAAGGSIPSGTMVTVLAMEGVKLIVREKEAIQPEKAETEKTEEA